MQKVSIQEVEAGTSQQERVQELSHTQVGVMLGKPNLIYNW